MRLSRIIRYSASFEFFASFPLPDLHSYIGMQADREIDIYLCVRKRTIVFVAFVAESKPEVHNCSAIGVNAK
jgi:hypothetical protein